MTKKTEGTVPGPDVDLTSWAHLLEQQAARVDAAYEELGRRQTHAVDQATAALGDLAKMAQDAVSLSGEVTREWLKVAQGSTRWATGLLGGWSR